MKEYIDKTAVKAEIEKRIASLESIGSENYLHDNYPEQYAMLVTLKSLKFSLDTLEVKEVEEELVSNDLEEEIDKELHENWYGEYIDLDKFRESSKHFFELGLKTKGE